MEPTKANAEKFTSRMEVAGQTVTASEKQESQSTDEGRKRLVKKMLVEPFADAGFDLDATLANYAKRLNDGSLTNDEQQVAILVLYMFQTEAPDLARWGYIRNETKDLVKAVHDKIQ